MSINKYAVVFLIAATAANGADAKSVCRVNIAVVKNGQPLLDAAKISVINTRTEQLVTSTAAHRLSTKIDCGIRYRAEVDYRGTVKKQTFDVAMGATTDVTVGF